MDNSLLTKSKTSVSESLVTHESGNPKNIAPRKVSELSKVNVQPQRNYDVPKTTETWANVVSNNVRSHEINMIPATNNEDSNTTESWNKVVWKNVKAGMSSDIDDDEQVLSADVHLIAYGVAKHVTGKQFSQFLEKKGLRVVNCDFLTKFEDARMLSYKVSIKSNDFEKTSGLIE